MRQFYFSNHCGLNLSASEYSKRLYLCETNKFIRFFLFMMSKGNHYFAPGHAADGWRLWRNRDKRPCWRVILRLSFFFRNSDSSIPRFLTYFKELINSRIYFLNYWVALTKHEQAALFRRWCESKWTRISKPNRALILTSLKFWLQFQLNKWYHFLYVLQVLQVKPKARSEQTS